MTLHTELISIAIPWISSSDTRTRLTKILKRIMHMQPRKTYISLVLTQLARMGVPAAGISLT